MPHDPCTYGIGAKALVDEFLDGDVSRVASYGARFAGVLVPAVGLATAAETRASWSTSGQPGPVTGCEPNGLLAGEIPTTRPPNRSPANWIDSYRRHQRAGGTHWRVSLSGLSLASVHPARGPVRASDAMDRTGRIEVKPHGSS
jgi:hypothetical protein